MSSWLVWREAALRPKPAITKQDIGAAVEWFKTNTGKEAASIGLNPANQKFFDSEDLVLVLVGGCSRCEIWVSSTDMSIYYRQTHADSKDMGLSAPRQSVEILEADPILKSSYATTPTQAKKHAGGRPRKEGKVSRSAIWRREKKDREKQLVLEGI